MVLENFTAYAEWEKTLHSTRGLVGSKEFQMTSQPEVKYIYYFGQRPGLVNLTASISNTLGTLPGAIFMRGASVALFVLTKIHDKTNVLMIEQPRVPVAKKTLEIPAGMMDDDKCFKNVAVKEAIEETGLKVDKEKIVDLGEVLVSPGGSDEKLRILAVEIDDFQPSNKILGHDGEQIKSHIMPLQEALSKSDDMKLFAALGKALVSDKIKIEF